MTPPEDTDTAYPGWNLFGGLEGETVNRRIDNYNPTPEPSTDVISPLGYSHRVNPHQMWTPYQRYKRLIRATDDNSITCSSSHCNVYYSP